MSIVHNSVFDLACAIDASNVLMTFSLLFTFEATVKHFHLSYFTRPFSVLFRTKIFCNNYGTFIFKGDLT